MAVGTTADRDRQRMQVSEPTAALRRRVSPRPGRGGPVVRYRGADPDSGPGSQIDLQRVAESLGFDLPVDASREICMREAPSNSAAFCVLIFMPDMLYNIRL